MPAEGKPVGSAPEPANGAASKSRDGQTPPTRLLLTGSSHHFIGSIRPSVRPGHHGGTCHPPFTSTGEGVDQGRVQHLCGGGGDYFISCPKTKHEACFWQRRWQLSSPWHVYVQTVTSLPPPFPRLVSPTGKLFSLRAGWQ